MLVLFLVAFAVLLMGCKQIQGTSQASQATFNQQGQQLQGYLTNLKINANSFKQGTPIIVTGTFVPQTDGNYYIEVGIDKASRQSLTILKSSQSACDQSKNYAGVWHNNARANEQINFELTLQDYGETGKYNIVGGVYSRCGVGADIASIEPIQISITASQPQVENPSSPTNDNINPPSPAQPTTCTPSGYFKQVWFRELGVSDLGDNGIPRVVGVFKNNAPCTITYYIEAGMLESTYKPLTAIPSISGARGILSACDGNIHFSGVKLTMKANEEKGFLLYPQNYGRDGRYRLQGGVFYNNGRFCGNADIASFPEQEVVFAGFGSSAVADSWIKII